jgi:hypothetical protein
VTILLYTDCVVIASVVLCAGYVIVVVKRFADTCYKGEESVAEGVVCCKDKEDKHMKRL